jgi:deoxyribodipyrimidine photolyase-related protein
VIDAVQRHFPENPGGLGDFDWPVTREQALVALRDFLDHRLELFGRYQDAMWTAQPFLYHARISAALNLKLLDPREVADAAVTAWREGRAGLASVEGFVRQIIGWREFIRGVYWLEMPGLAEANHFEHTRDLPRWFWTGETHMACQREAITQTLRYGYAHHIQRLMVTGLFGLLAEIAPRQVAHWYLAVYVDAVEWVELPNVAGMALYANGGRFTSKPYAASGAYIQRMSNYCAGCRYDPGKKVGDDACPLTTLYWNFLDRHEEELGSSPRTALMVKNLQRLSADERAAVRNQAREVLGRLDEL